MDVFKTLQFLSQLDADEHNPKILPAYFLNLGVEVPKVSHQTLGSDDSAAIIATVDPKRPALRL